MYEDDDQLTLDLEECLRPSPRWPVVEESEWWARKGRVVEVIGYL